MNFVTFLTFWSYYIASVASEYSTSDSYPTELHEVVTFLKNDYCSLSSNYNQLRERLDDLEKKCLTKDEALTTFRFNKLLVTLNENLVALSGRKEVFETSPVPDPPTCPAKTKEINSLCYLMSSAKANLFGARASCLDQGGYLATPTPTTLGISTLLAALRVNFPLPFLAINNDIPNTFIRVDGVEVGGSSGNGDFINLKNGMVLLHTQTDILTRTVVNSPESLSLTPRGDANTVNKLSALGNGYVTYYLCQFDKV